MVYAIRVALLADRLTHPNQPTFIQGRFILDVLVFHEVLHEVNIKQQKAVFLKLDFHKAYDTVQWAFLEEVLQRKGFDDRWITRVMQLVSSGRTAININWEIGPYFPTWCGVRQGDPLSPSCSTWWSMPSLLYSTRPKWPATFMALSHIWSLGVCSPFSNVRTPR